MVFLLIDDDPIANLIHRKIIETAYMEMVEEIVPFSSAREALEFLVENINFENKEEYVVLLDINMPGINGWEFLELLNKSNSSCKNVYILSSSVAQTDKAKAQNYPNVKGYITKPLSVPSLRYVLKEHLTA